MKCFTANQPAGPILRAKQPDEGNDNNVEKRWVVGGIERICIVVAVRPFAPAEVDRIHQLESFALVVVEWKAKQLDRIDEIDDQVTDKGQKRETNDYSRKPVQSFVPCGLPGHRIRRSHVEMLA